MRDKATGEWTELLNHEKFRRKSIKRGQPHTWQGMGEQNLQIKVNIGNEQSGLFPLRLYSKDKRDDESLREKKMDALQHSKRKLLE